MAADEKYDYSALEQEARAVMLPGKYGMYGYILSPEHGLAFDGCDRLEVTGEFSFDTGYICGHAAIWLYNKMLELGREPTLCKGKDSRSMFNYHYFVQDEDGDVLDAVPWFEFKGEKHKPKQFPLYHLVDRSLMAHYFLHLQEADGSIYMACFDFPKYLEHEMGKGAVDFELSIFDTDRKQYAQFNVRANLFRYRLCFPEEYTGYTVEENAEENLAYLIGQGAIEKHEFGPYEGDKPLDGDDLARLETVLMRSLPAELALIHKLAYMQPE